MSKMGRPKKPKAEARGVHVSTRVSPVEYKEIMQAVRESKLAKTEWVRTSLLNTARAK
jgi:hypothetical protein